MSERPVGLTSCSPKRPKSCSFPHPRRHFVFPQILIPFTGEGSLQVEHNTDLPDYLPEDESPSQEPDKAVSRVGDGQGGATWLGTAANFLSRSFYW